MNKSDNEKGEDKEKRGQKERESSGHYEPDRAVSVPVRWFFL